MNCALCCSRSNWCVRPGQCVNELPRPSPPLPSPPPACSGSPSGRLTTTVYPAEFVLQRDMSDYQLAPHVTEAGSVPGITYLYYDGTPLFPFGFGLSYTTFSFAWVSGSEGVEGTVDAAGVVDGTTPLPPYAVNVTNTGSVVSDVSALAFVSTGVAGEPLQQLFDFQRAARVAPGASVVLVFTLAPELASVVRADGARVLVPGTQLVRCNSTRVRCNCAVVV
jgi:hypothetical protein